ncbi:MAG TPA: LysR family transcriptional regulator [Stellaceae bacterium]|nr:LysR family transcriptional regulator [Stellaceae bacterium]
METRFLDSFIAVIDKGSFAEAARHLHVTPAAIAQRVQALEAEIGARLFVRSGRTVVPTAAGSAILMRSRAILQDVRALRSIAADDELAGELRLGAVATAMTGILPELLKRYSAAFPRIDVYVAPGASRDLYPKVLDGELDAAIIVQPEFALPKTCDWRVLREEPLVVISSSGADGSDPHEILRSHPFIRYDRSHWGGRLGDTYLRRMGIRPRERFELDSLDAIAVLVDRGLGVSLVPDWAPPWPAGLALRKHRLPDATLVRRIGVLWLRSSARARHVLAFLG